eukprot:GEMP01040355.1.p1 GENE.GEMP01040355.1~~GEMP01040355.1.p1  ORF type:complete len:255 (+),score=59.58 GEMP01040355.1:170-934(+)
MGNVCCADERAKITTAANADSAKYEKAVATENVEALVELLESSQPVRIDFMHPWAKHPSTVGALSAMQLSVFLANSAKYPGLKDKLREIGAIRTLVRYLSASEDRVHAALLAFAYLVVRDGELPHKQNCAEVHGVGGLALLIQQFKSPIEGARFAVADVCNMICAANETYKSDFADQGGLKYLVAEIKGPEENALVYIDYLEEIMSDRDGHAARKYVMAAKAAGAEAKVKAYSKGSAEAREAVHRVMSLFGAVK